MKRDQLSLLEATILPVAGALSLLIVWQWVLPALGVPAYIVPTPLSVLRTFASEWRGLVQNALPTWYEALLGFFLGNLTAVILAIVFVYSPRVRAAYFPVVLLFNTIRFWPWRRSSFSSSVSAFLPKVVIAALLVSSRRSSTWSAV